MSWANSCSAAKDLERLDKEILAVERKRKKLIDLRLENSVDKATYDEKNADWTAKLVHLSDERQSLQDTAATEQNIKKRISVFRSVLEQNEALTVFDRYIFESIVEKVIVGRLDDDGNKDPSMLTFIYNTGFTNNIDQYRWKRVSA